MTLVENDRGYLCTWCGEPVEQVLEPGPYDTNMVGICEQDAIVYVTLDPDEVNA